MRRVGNDGNSNLGEISLDLGDVALLLLTVSKVLPLVSDRSTSSGGGRRRDRSSLRRRGKPTSAFDRLTDETVSWNVRR